MTNPANTSPANTSASGAAAAGTSGGAGSAPGGFVDFYQLLDAPADATTTALRRRINDLYSEAQSNRDHRNPNRRRHYEALCDLLPYCRIVLLDPDKRARYDRYMSEARSGASGVPDFESMMEEIAGRVGDVAGDSDEKVGLLGVEGDDDYLPVAPSTTTTANKAAAGTASVTGATSRPAASATESVTMAGTAGRQRRLSKAAMSSLAGSVFSVVAFAIIGLIVWLVRDDIVVAVLCAAIAGLVIWLVTHLRPDMETERGDRDRITS